MSIGDGIEIPLTRGLFALVDRDSVPKLGRLKWQAHWYPGSRTHYAKQTYIDNDGRKRSRFMHRMLLDAGPGSHIDHINHNGLDNRLCNIRLCTPFENARNTRGHKPGYKGVSYSTKKRAWIASITVHGKFNFIGHFNSALDAALAYNAKAKEYFGEFAFLNDVEGPTPERRQHGTSRFEGVAFHKDAKKWRAYITIDGKQVHVGLFATEEEAFVARQLFLKGQSNEHGNTGCSAIGVDQQSAGEALVPF